MTGLALALLLLGGEPQAATAPPNFALFKAEVAAHAKRFGLPMPEVLIVSPINDVNRWSWVSQCPERSRCRPTINIRTDVLLLLSTDALRLIALHEVIHVRRGDIYDPRWDADNQTPEALAYQAREHRKIAKEVTESFDESTLYWAGESTKAWKRRWATSR